MSRSKKQPEQKQDTLIKPATKIIVKPASEYIADSQLKSHVGGSPYFEMGEWWPQTREGGQLQFVFQVFNDGKIALPKNIKLLQFYYDGRATSTEDEGWLVKIYESLDKENILFIEKPDDSHVQYHEIEFKPIESLPCDADTWSLCSQLGGYPHWIQGGTDEFDDYEFLFQFDSMDINWDWHDSGAAYVFYNQKSGKTGFRLEGC